MCPPSGLIFDVACDCFRREPSKMLDRLQSFRMREYVCIGTPEQIQDFRARWMKRAEGFAGQLGLTYRIDQASDPFFGRGGKLMAMSQVEQELKFELLVPVHSEEEPTACMSFNYHRDHFGTTWNLRHVRRDGAYRLRRFRHRPAGLGVVRHSRRRVAAMADAGAPSAGDLAFSLIPVRAGSSATRPKSRIRYRRDRRAAGVAGL